MSVTTTMVSKSEDVDGHLKSSGDDVEISDQDEDRHELSKSPQKRKREANETNLEVDLSLPEPPSKKALRKAKKHHKSEPKSANAESTVQEHEGASVSKEKNSKNDAEEAKVEKTSTQKAPKPSKPKSAHSVWIGNLPFAATKPMLTDFLATYSEPRISREAITRVHMPAPSKAVATRSHTKPMNKGFAYVDFADQQSFMAALALSETLLGSRKLLIKDAKSFEGRPEEHGKPVERVESKSVSRRIFVGNLGFDVTQEELQSFFQVCGEIEHIHMATFQDSGKCKGFAWVTFVDTTAARAAVRGWTHEILNEDRDDDDSDRSDTEQKSKKPQRRTIYCNRLHGRDIRREFAEDAATRYKKRFGKGSKGGEAREATEADETPQAIKNAEKPETAKSRALYKRREGKDFHPSINPGAPTDPMKRRGRTHTFAGSGDAGETAEEMMKRTQYRRGQISESTGTKTTFD